MAKDAIFPQVDIHAVGMEPNVTVFIAYATGMPSYMSLTAAKGVNGV